MVCCMTAPSYYLIPCWLTNYHLCDSLASIPLLKSWLNSLRPSDAIWRQRSGSMLAQVMACCLTAPCHYLNPCWLVINWVQWHSSEGNFSQPPITKISLKITYLKFHKVFPGVIENEQDISSQVSFKIYTFEIAAISPRGQWVNGYFTVTLLQTKFHM